MDARTRRFAEYNLDPALAEMVEAAPEEQMLEGILRLEGPALIPPSFTVVSRFHRILHRSVSGCTHLDDPTASQRNQSQSGATFGDAPEQRSAGRSWCAKRHSSTGRPAFVLHRTRLRRRVTGFWFGLHPSQLSQSGRHHTAFKILAPRRRVRSGLSQSVRLRAGVFEARDQCGLASF